VDISVEALLPHKAVKVLGSHEHIREVVALSEVVYWEPDLLDAMLVVDFFHLLIQISSLPEVVDRHQVQHSGDASLLQADHVIF